MSLDGTAPAGHHGLSVMELAAMEVVHAHLLGPVTITRDTINLLVEDSGTACVRGVVAKR